MAHAQRNVAIGSRVGLHARPASLFVQAVTASGHRVTVTTADGESALADSILSVLALGVPHGASVTVDVEGDDAEGVATSLAELLASDMDAS